MSKKLNLSVEVEFPSDVNLEDVNTYGYGLNHVNDFCDILFEYKKLNTRNGYLPIKEEGYRWMFFSDTYEEYSSKDEKMLKMDPVFNQKWYKNKYMTIYFIDQNFKVFRRVLPASKREYEEESCLFDKLYKIFRENQDFIGKYIKRNKSKDLI